MKAKFVAPNDPVLIQKASPVEIGKLKSPKIIEIISTMLDTAYNDQENREKPFLVGLAAPQIGISKRIILVDRLADGKGKAGDLRIYINPEISWVSDEENEWYEGCASTDRVCGIVSRSSYIKVKALDQDGYTIEDELSFYTARIFQHETDHLNGVEFVSHITDPNKLHWVEDSEFPAYRNQTAWRTWPKKCSFEKWEKIKGTGKII